MSAQLAQLIGKSTDDLTGAIHKLESLSGFNGIDNQILSEVRAKLWPKIAELGLDPADTTPSELYHGVQARFGSDNKFFHAVINGSETAQDKINRNLTRLLKITGVSADAWVLKRKIAKDLLADSQPKKLQKYLNYRSAASMLKREGIAELWAALPLLESNAWQKKLDKRLLRLQPSDFEIRPIEFFNMNAERWRIIQPAKVVTRNDLLGSVVLWPNNRIAVNSLASFIDMISSAETIALNSLELMDSQVRPDFSHSLANFLKATKKSNFNSFMSLNWHNLAHFYNYLPAGLNPMTAEPHMQDVDMPKLSAAKVISSIHPILRWWESNDYLGVNSSTNPVSLNLSDAAHNHQFNKDYKTNASSHLSFALWNEILARYMAHPAVENAVLRSLAGPDRINEDEYAVNPEKLNQEALQSA